MLSLRTPVRSVLLSLVAAAMTLAQTVNWYPATAPGPRASPGFAYDAATHTAVLFGGSGDNSITYGDTWIWLGGWRQLYPSASPSARQGPAMAYDRAAGNIVLFGGCTNGTATCTYLNDTWTWDGSTWTQQFPAASPSPRVSNMAYDEAAGTVVLFGGTNGVASTLGDTWTWDGTAKTWTQRKPSASPSARLAPLTYDAATKTVVLFGGGVEYLPGSGGFAYGDTWNWDGRAWTQQFPASAPSARAGAAMAYDPDLGALVLFGGAPGGDYVNSTNDTWTWDGTNWTQIFPANKPPDRFNFGMAYDPVVKATLIFGGFSTGLARGGPWLLALAP